MPKKKQDTAIRLKVISQRVSKLQESLDRELAHQRKKAVAPPAKLRRPQ